MTINIWVQTQVGGKTLAEISDAAEAEVTAFTAGVPGITVDWRIDNVSADNSSINANGRPGKYIAIISMMIRTAG